MTNEVVEALTFERLPADAALGRYHPPYDDFFSWLYFSNPNLGERASGLLLAHKEREVAGNLGSVQQPLWMDGREVDATYLMALGVEPQFRRRGIASRLLEEMGREHELMVMVGMTPAARKLYESLGYENLGRIVQMVWIADPTALVRYLAEHPALEEYRRRLEQGPVERILGPLSELGRGAVGSRLSSGMRGLARRITRVTSRGTIVRRERPTFAELDDLWVRARGTHRIVAKRDAAWVKWRYWDCPLFAYDEYYAYDDDRLVGYAMTKSFESTAGLRVGVLVDLFTAANDDATFDALVSAALDHLVAERVDLVRAMFTSPWARARARRAGFLDPMLLPFRARVPGREVFIAGPLASRTSLVDWWMTRGDSEQDFNDAGSQSELLARRASPQPPSPRPS